MVRILSIQQDTAKLPGNLHGNVGTDPFSFGSNPGYRIFALTLNGIYHINIIHSFLKILYMGYSVAIHGTLASMIIIDADAVVITSIEGVFSPPFVLMVATALRNKEVLIAGVITGIIGWVIGTYLGIGYAYLLKILFW